MPLHPGIRGQRIVDGCGERILGGQSVVDSHDDAAAHCGQQAARGVVRVEIAGHPSAAVVVDDGRRATAAPGGRPDACAVLAVDPDEEVRSTLRPRDDPTGHVHVGPDGHGQPRHSGESGAQSRRVVGLGRIGRAVREPVHAVDQGEEGLHAPVEHPSVTLHRRAPSRQTEHETGPREQGRAQAGRQRPALVRPLEPAVVQHPAPTPPPWGTGPRPIGRHGGGRTVTWRGNLGDTTGPAR